MADNLKDTKIRGWLETVGKIGVGLAAATATALLHIKAGGTGVGTAPLKLTTQPAGLDVVEQGAMELIGNSLQFTQKARRRGVAMTQGVRVLDTQINNNTNNSYVSFTASISGTNMTVTAIASGVLMLGAHIHGTGVVGSLFIVSQTSGAAGSTGVYIVSKSLTVASTSTFEAGLIIASHGANYPEVGKMEEILLRGTFQQTAAGSGQFTINVRYGSTASVIALTTPVGVIASGNFELRVISTYRTINASTGTIQFNAELMIRTTATSTTTIVGNAVYTGDTTIEADTIVSGVRSVANASNLFVTNQGRVLCIESDK